KPSAAKAMGLRLRRKSPSVVRVEFSVIWSRSAEYPKRVFNFTLLCLSLLQAHASVSVGHSVNCEIQRDMETTAVDTLGPHSTSRPRPGLKASVAFPRQRRLGGFVAGTTPSMSLLLPFPA